jgi:hypothetical protein
MRPKMKGEKVLKRGSMLICKVIAPKFGVSPKTVRDIWRGRTWLHATQHLWTDEEKKVKADQDRIAMNRTVDINSHSSHSHLSAPQGTPVEATCRIQAASLDRLGYPDPCTQFAHPAQQNAAENFCVSLSPLSAKFDVPTSLSHHKQLPANSMAAPPDWLGTCGRNSSTALPPPQWKERSCPAMLSMLIASAAPSATVSAAPPAIDPAFLRLLMSHCTAAPTLPAAYPAAAAAAAYGFPCLGNAAAAASGPFPQQLAGLQAPRVRPGGMPLGRMGWAGPR